MATTLIKNAKAIVTVDDADQVLRNANMLIRDIVLNILVWKINMQNM